MNISPQTAPTLGGSTGTIRPRLNLLSLNQHMNIKHNLIAVFLIAGLFVGSVILTHQYIKDIGVDWTKVYRPAGFAIIQGRSPYGITELPFVNPPWVALALFPIALLPALWGSAFMFVLNFFAYLWVGAQFKMRAWTILPFLILGGAVNNSFNGNIEGLIALGLCLPPQIGLFFVLAKPQIGLAVAIFWAAQAWRNGGYKELIRIFTPVTIAFLISFLLYGLWILQFLDMPAVGWNASIFPHGIPIGLFLLVISIWKRNLFLAIAASPFFSPYLTLHSWAFAWLGILAFLDTGVRDLWAWYKNRTTATHYILKYK